MACRREGTPEELVKWHLSIRIRQIVRPITTHGTICLSSWTTAENVRARNVCDAFRSALVRGKVSQVRIELTARVFKGMRMAGQMGNEKVKVQNLAVVKVVSEKNLLVVKGCVPGHKNSYVIVQK